MIVPRDKRKLEIKMIKRFQFSSALRRMSVVVQVDRDGRTSYLATVKGAPEVLHAMMQDKCPTDFDRLYKQFAREGYRVLALGYKSLKVHSIHQASQSTRELVESNLTFAGFLIFHCPLKEDSKEAVLSLKDSSHFVCFILELIWVAHMPCQDKDFLNIFTFRSS
jgi:manganese-transporting P-type ATPase